MDIDELIKKYNFRTIPVNLRPNAMFFPINRVDITAEGCDIFNEFYKELIHNKDYSPIIKTPSGGISYDIKKGFRIPSFDADIQLTHGDKIKAIDLRIITPEQMCIVKISGRPQDTVGGSKAFQEFSSIFRKFHIDISKYAAKDIEEGLKYKDEITKVHIELGNQGYRDIPFESSHHLDWNSSYSTGLINTHPEFEKPLTYMYENRHQNIKGYKDYYKGVMNSSIGWMQSEYDNYKHAMLSRDAINDNNRRIEELAQKLEDSGRIVLLYNTDGIWYHGDLYHDEDEGKNLGQWKNDHINCLFRAKSDGAYEYIEDDKYHVVLRGRTKYDNIKPRSEWEWGDIYRDDAEPLHFQFIEGEGIIYE